MRKQKKQPYITPRVNASVGVLLEGPILFGSIAEHFNPVETIGQETGGFYDYEPFGGESSTFNHTWGD